MKQKNLASEIISRLLIAYGIQEQRGSASVLARKLKTKGSVVSGWRTRGVPEQIIARAIIDTGVGEKWLRTGEGPMRPGPRGDNLIFSATSGGNELSPDESRLLTAYRKLNPDRRERMRAIMEDLAELDGDGLN